MFQFNIQGCRVCDMSWFLYHGLNKGDNRVKRVMRRLRCGDMRWIPDRKHKVGRPNERGLMTTVWLKQYLLDFAEQMPTRCVFRFVSVPGGCTTFWFINILVGSQFISLPFPGSILKIPKIYTIFTVVKDRFCIKHRYDTAGFVNYGGKCNVKACIMMAYYTKLKSDQVCYCYFSTFVMHIILIYSKKNQTEASGFTCTTCTNLRRRIRAATTRAEMTTLREKLKAHVCITYGAREELAWHKSMASKDDSYCLVMADAADQTKLGCPSIRQGGRAGDRVKRIKQQFVGLIIHGKGYYIYRRLPVTQKGANLTATILVDLFAKGLLKQVRVLVLQWDGLFVNDTLLATSSSHSHTSTYQGLVRTSPKQIGVSQSGCYCKIRVCVP